MGTEIQGDAGQLTQNSLRKFEERYGVKCSPVRAGKELAAWPGFYVHKAGRLLAVLSFRIVRGEYACFVPLEEFRGGAWATEKLLIAGTEKPILYYILANWDSDLRLFIYNPEPEFLWQTVETPDGPAVALLAANFRPFQEKTAA